MAFPTFSGPAARRSGQRWWTLWGSFFRRAAERLNGYWADAWFAYPRGRECHDDAQGVVRKAGDLRLIILMITLAKIMARQVDKALASIAASCVVAPERVFVTGRLINENIYELEGSFVEYSILSRGAAILSLDFQAVLPSLDRKSMFAVLHRMGVPSALICFVSALYEELVEGIHFKGGCVGRMPMSLGIQQGCPRSCTRFALTLDPLVRSYISNATLASSRLCAFEDDIGLALARLPAQLGLVRCPFDRWSRASALRLNPRKWMLIAAGCKDAARQVLMQYPRYSGMKLQDFGKYLGVMVGLGVQVHQ